MPTGEGGAASFSQIARVVASALTTAYLRHRAYQGLAKKVAKLLSADRRTGTSINTIYPMHPDRVADAIRARQDTDT